MSVYNYITDPFSIEQQAEMCIFRPRQLHRRGDISRPSATEPATSPLRVLDPRGRLDHHCAACGIGDNLHMLLHRHLPGARLARHGGDICHNRHSLGVGTTGLLGRQGRSRGSRPGGRERVVGRHCRGTIAYEWSVEPCRGIRYAHGTRQSRSRHFANSFFEIAIARPCP